MDARLRASAATPRQQADPAAVIKTGNTLQQLRPDSLTTPVAPRTLKGLSPTDFFLLREDYPGYLPAKNHILTDLLEHIKHSKSPVAMQVWDGGPGADLAEDVTHCLHNAAAEVLEPDPNYYQFMRRYVASNPQNRVVPINQDVLNHTYKGRYDLVASLFTLNRLRPEQCRQVLRNLRQNGLMPEGLAYFAGQFIPDNASRRGTARYFSNLLFHCLSHHKLQAAQLVLSDWYQTECRQGKTVLSTDLFEQLLAEEGFHYFRERIWPNKLVSRLSVYPDDNSGVFVYKTWLAHDQSVGGKRDVSQKNLSQNKLPATPSRIGDKPASQPKAQYEPDKLISYG
jgi:hypothetical protein